MNVSSTTGSILLDALNSKSTSKNSKASELIQQCITSSRERVNKIIEEYTGTSMEVDTEKYETVSSDAKKLSDTLSNFSVTDFVSNYNTLMEDIEELGGTIETVYGAKLTDLIESGKDALANIGISVSEDYKLTVDEEKLETIDQESVAEVLGTDSDILENLASILTDMTELIDRAVTIKQAVGSSYTSSGEYSSNDISQNVNYIA